MQQDSVTCDDKEARSRQQAGNRHDKITNSSIKRVVRCKCMRVPASNVLGKLFLREPGHVFRVAIRTKPLLQACLEFAIRLASSDLVFERSLNFSEHQEDAFLPLPRYSSFDVPFFFFFFFNIEVERQAKPVELMKKRIFNRE